MAKWQYLIRSTQLRGEIWMMENGLGQQVSIRDALTQLGADGWELVAVQLLQQYAETSVHIYDKPGGIWVAPASFYIFKKDVTPRARVSSAKPRPAAKSAKSTKTAKSTKAAKTRQTSPKSRS